MGGDDGCRGWYMESLAEWYALVVDTGWCPRGTDGEVTPDGRWSALFFLAASLAIIELYAPRPDGLIDGFEDEGGYSDSLPLTCR